jgi:hypothetical protein
MVRQSRSFVLKVADGSKYVLLRNGLSAGSITVPYGLYKLPVISDGFVARTRHLRSLRERLPEQPHKSEEQGRAGHLIHAEVKRSIEVIYRKYSEVL